MRFSATMFPTQPKTKLYKFGFKVDTQNIIWKSDGIKNLGDFRSKTVGSLIDPDHNQFNSICLWLEVSTDRGIGPLLGNIGTTFFEVNVHAQEDRVTTNKPPTINFKSVKLLSGKIVFPPPGSDDYGTWKVCQELCFYFDKASATWM